MIQHKGKSARMKSKALLALTFGIFLILCFAFQNCGRFAKKESESKVLPASIDERTAATEANSLRGYLCSKLANCFKDPLLSDGCINEVWGSSGLARRFSKSGSASFDRLFDAAVAESQGNLVPSAADSTACQLQIANLSCSDPAVASAFDPSSPLPYQNIGNIVPTSGACVNVYP